jgi:hypothetical protein
MPANAMEILLQLQNTQPRSLLEHCYDYEYEYEYEYERKRHPSIFWQGESFKLYYCSHSRQVEWGSAGGILIDVLCNVGSLLRFLDKSDYE